MTVVPVHCVHIFFQRYLRLLRDPAPADVDTEASVFMLERKGEI